MLTENKPASPAGRLSKYLIYAIGEIILVVIGILIALQININSQRETNRQQIESILKSVFLNLESDISHPITTYIQGFEEKDSISNIILNKTLSYADYKKTQNQSAGFSNHLNYEFEPFQFQTQAYDRLMANIEIIPDDYMPIVNLLQDVYGKEVPLVNEVALELKSFIDEIEDKYQTSFDWYSNTDSMHFKQKVDYMINSPMYLNDVKRHQNIASHLSQHLNALKMHISIAYSKIYNQLNYEEPFSDIIRQFYFPSEEELKEYTGIYRGGNGNGPDLILNSKSYYLTTASNSVKLVKVNDNKFIPTADPNGSYIEFERNANNDITAFKMLVIRNVKDTTFRQFKKIE